MAAASESFELVLAPSAARRLARLPPRIEHAIRSHLEEVRRVLSELPAPDLVTSRLSADAATYDVAVAGQTLEYAVDSHQRRLRLVWLGTADHPTARSNQLIRA